METFFSLTLMHQIYWILAAASSLVFIVQTIMMFMGGDADAPADDVPTDTAGDDFDTEGFHLVSIKSIVCFILGFGWTGVLFWDTIENRWLLGLLAVVVGMAFMSLIAFLLFQVRKLDKDNTFRVSQTVGLGAEVYLRIPAQRSGTGKVMVSVNGSMHELDAYTDAAEPIATGAKVRITQALDGDIVVVESL